MSIQKLKNRIKKIEGEVCGSGGRIPKEENLLMVQACTEKDAHEGFEYLKAELRERYGDLQERDVLCIWAKDYSEEVSEKVMDEVLKCWPGACNVKKNYVGWQKLPLHH